MPFNGKDYASEGFVQVNNPKAKGTEFEPTVLENTLVRGKEENMGQSVSMDSLTSDQPSFTGPAKGFFSKFGKGVQK